MDLLSPISEDVVKKYKVGVGKEIKWRMVTNHMNLLYIIGLGMVVPPAGFGGKYYSDLLSLVPGWIPLFAETMPEAAIEFSVSENQSLIPCYIEFDLSAVSGPVKAQRDGGWVDINFPQDVSEEDLLILVPAPLPITLIKDVVFKSKVDKERCEKRAVESSNIPLSAVSFNFKASAFKVPSKRSVCIWPLTAIELVDKRDVDLSFSNAVGGILAVLMSLAQKNPLAIEAYKVFYGSGEEVLRLEPPNLKGNANWQDLFSHINSFGRNDILRKIATKLVEWQRSGQTSALDEVLEQLTVDSLEYDDKKSRELSKNFIEDLQQLVRFPSKSIHDLLECWGRQHSRALILFFALEKSSELLDFTDPLWGDSESVAAAILFGIRDGWLKLPNRFKDVGGLCNAAPFIMAKMSHQISDSLFNLGEPPTRPKFLLELFLDNPWTNSQKEAALYLSRALKWNCIKTKISLSKGDYKLNVDSSGAHFYIDGDVKVEPQIDREEFLKLFISDKSMTVKQELELRKLMRL